MEEGTIDEWLVEVGQKVAKGDILAEVSTDKITNSVISLGDGYMRKYLVEEGETVPCGEVIALMTESAEEALTESSGTPEAMPEHGSAAEAVQEPLPEARTQDNSPVAGEVAITPRARKLAEEQNLLYSHIKGTGLLGAITVDDLKEHGKPRLDEAVQADVAVPSPAAVPESVAASGMGYVRKLSAIEKKTAQTMHDSMAGTAQTTIATEVDMTQLVSVYRELKDRYAQEGVRLTYTACIIKAVAMALEDHPKIRTTLIDEEQVRISNRISVGVAVDLPDDSLIVPVIRDANLLDLRSIALKLRDLTERARNNALQYEELGDASITVSNMGNMGVTYFTPVLNPPEGALLGVGAMREQIVVNQGCMTVAPVIYLSLTYDHRIINGGPAARFLEQVVDTLQHFPEF